LNNGNLGIIALEHVSLQYAAFPAIEEITFEASPGQFVALVGPTGCGKSSVLNLVAGLLTPTTGRVQTGGKEVGGVNHQCAYMFQSDGLLPWKSVLDNVLLGPLLRGASKSEATGLARDWITRVGLKGFEGRYSHQLSGGQRKRVAMAQALVNHLPILLMDEPFSALDAQTRALMEQELLTLSQEIGATVLFVTHDLEEAIALSDRVLLFSSGPRATIKGDYAVNLGRPRNVVEARFMPGFSEIYEELWSSLKEEVMATYERTRAS